MPETPAYFELLNSIDQSTYSDLQKRLSSSDCRNCRNKRLDNFNEMLDEIRHYTNKADGDDWKRSLVCGVCFLSDGIAINTHQLSILIGKCKSSINGSLHRLKYVPFPCSNAASQELVTLIPKLKVNYSELRQWTLRKKGIMTPQPMVHENKPLPTPIFITPQPEPKVNAMVQPRKEEAKTDDFFYDDPIMLPISGWNDEIDIKDPAESFDPSLFMSDYL
ncbi:hypothetical protein TVAG_024440 [Trichomonas vaginalis G3]|uniref:Initiator binding domain-containing protein n=1 Tax=Trichomonas vaginalis (strain ATCC PRA-98 / G3) TaxID=412133 RepID=A2G638_TRIV3|nr:transcription-initiator DNA-binding domain ibd family [Trichomonas vaginalis G3]EAX87378.1 hypothetical protein TVAG_024440 [Trichomonas vaginalis G3]KAI5503149.1 transcription-initiator DNA-binding domain ibd family [Trichomonas vaginalis G3]|eukprot:XP_001300308.1 hypothetical protein [Trichomonas vaginalis G3]